MMQNATEFRFGDFRLDVPGRRLWQGDRAIDLSGRYFDALVLLLREHGQLISKDRFFEEVWSGVIVSDSALTQCIKEIRRQLGDDAAAPRFVQTVPRYGYRFVAPVETPERVPPHAPPLPRDEATLPLVPQERSPLELAFLDGLAGTLGGGAAGLAGGLFYGLVVAGTAAGNGVGTVSTAVVLAGLGLLIGLAGGAGVSFGMAAGRVFNPRKGWTIAGAALGGLLVGGMGDLLGLDVFNLLFGHPLSGITGALEGAVLGALLATGAVGAGGFESTRPWRPVLGAAIAGGTAGVLIPLAGGHLFAGSLNNLVIAFSGSRLRLDALGALFGEHGLGPTALAALGGIEGFLFAACVTGGFLWARLARQKGYRGPGLTLTSPRPAQP